MTTTIRVFAEIPSDIRRSLERMGVKFTGRRKGLNQKAVLPDGWQTTSHDEHIPFKGYTDVFDSEGNRRFRITNMRLMGMRVELV